MTVEPQRRIYYGWWIVLGSLCGTPLGSVSVYFTFGVFLKPIAETFLLSRGEIALAVSLKSIGSIISAPVIGWLIDRYGVRPVVAVSTFCFAVGLFSIRFLPHEMGYLYLFFFLLGMADNGTTFLAYGTLVSRWFERHRGLALGITMCGAGIGGFLLPPLFHFLIVRLGWVDAYAVLAALSSIMIPIALWLFKESPQELGLLPDGDVPSGSSMRTEKKIINGMTLGEAWRTPTFWFLGASFFLMSASINGIMIHLVPFLTDHGMEASRAALYVSLLAGASLFGRLFAGYMADRWIAKFVAGICFTCAAAGALILWSTPGEGLLAVATFSVGLALGAEIDLSGYLVGKCFGLASFGQIYSYMFVIFVLGVAVGPAYAGALFDRTGSYDGALLSFSGAMLASAVLMLPVQSFSEAQADKAKRVSVA